MMGGKPTATVVSIGKRAVDRTAAADVAQDGVTVEGGSVVEVVAVALGPTLKWSSRRARPTTPSPRAAAVPVARERQPAHRRAAVWQ